MNTDCLPGEYDGWQEQDELAEQYQQAEFHAWLDEYDKETEKLRGTEMKIKVEEGKGDFKPVPAGNHTSICTGVAFIGYQNITYQGNTKTLSQLIIRWEIPGERVEIDGVSKPMIIYKTYTVSLYVKSALYNDLVSWRGKKFTQEEMEGFDVFNVVGAPCQLNIVHDEYNGKVYAKIKSIAQLPKDTKKPIIEGDVFKYDEEHEGDWDILPKWIQKKIENQVAAESSNIDSGHVAAGEDESDIPF